MSGTSRAIQKQQFADLFNHLFLFASSSVALLSLLVIVIDPIPFHRPWHFHSRSRMRAGERGSVGLHGHPICPTADALPRLSSGGSHARIMEPVRSVRRSGHPSFLSLIDYVSMTEQSNGCAVLFCPGLPSQSRCPVDCASPAPVRWCER